MQGTSSLDIHSDLLKVKLEYFSKALLDLFEPVVTFLSMKNLNNPLKAKFPYWDRRIDC